MPDKNPNDKKNLHENRPPGLQNCGTAPPEFFDFLRAVKSQLETDPDHSYEEFFAVLFRASCQCDTSTTMLDAIRAVLVNHPDLIEQFDNLMRNGDQYVLNHNFQNKNL